MLRYNEKDTIPTIKYVLIAGEKLYGHDIVDGSKAWGDKVEFVNLYGPSETTLAKLYYRIKKDDGFDPNEIIPIGKPIPDTEVLIIQNGKHCSPRVPGEIHIKTDYMSNGYFNAPELNQASFIQNPLNSSSNEIVFKTGDIGEYRADGNIKILGRQDHQIKFNGIRIELEDIEVALRQHVNVHEAAVVAKEDLLGNSRLIAYVVPKGKDVSVDDLRNFIKNSLPLYMIPSIFVKLDEMPVTYSNKVNRKALPAPPKIRPNINEPFLPPSGRLEKKLCKVWREILDIDQVGMNDNFFDLGGTSLMIARLADRIGEMTGNKIPVVKLFQYPNITLFAKYLRNEHIHNHSYDKIQNRANKRKAAIQKRRQIPKRVIEYGQPEF
jgi:acyl carrier protein